jgi:cobaltochelatase CobN
LSAHNPAALAEMAERMLDAIERELWKNPGERKQALADLLIDAEEIGT